MNIAAQPPFVAAARELLGEHGCYPLLAVGTFGEKSGFKLYADIQGIDPTTANEITSDIDAYNEALKQADEESIDSIRIDDYITNKEHLQIFKESTPYQGIIENGKCHACGHLVFNGIPSRPNDVGYGDIRYEIGLVRCISQNGNSTIVANIEGGLLDSLGYVKDDFLIVDVVSIINKLYSALGRDVPTVTELREMVKDDPLTWKMYEIGATCSLNQCEKTATTRRVMQYKPQNPKELAAFIAGIRPGFKSLIDGFLARELYSNGETAIDDLLEDCFHYMIYQEAVMKIFSWLGIPMKDSYDTIKKISKKKLKGEALKHVEDTLKSHWLENIGNLDNFEPVYKVIKDSARYSFNAPHALAMCFDSLYEAWVKAHHTSVFYEVTLNHYQNKGDKDKVNELEQEAVKMFGYKIGQYGFGQDNSKFVVDDATKTIYPNLGSVKGISESAIKQLVEIHKSGAEDIVDVYVQSHGSNVNKTILKKLIMIGYFRELGSVKKLLRCIDIIDTWKGAGWDGKKTLKKSDPIINQIPPGILSECATDITSLGKVSSKQYKILDWIKIVKSICNNIPNDEFSSWDLARSQYLVLGYCDYLDPSLEWRTAIVMNYDDTRTPKFDAYCVQNGAIVQMKVHRRKPWKKNAPVRNPTLLSSCPIQDGDIIFLENCAKEEREHKVDGCWVSYDPPQYDWWAEHYHIVEPAIELQEKKAC